MPFTTTVIESYPERRAGYLRNPEAGGNKIFFDFTGQRKKCKGELVETRSDVFPAARSEVEVVEVSYPNPQWPKAVIWRLVTAAKSPKKR